MNTIWADRGGVHDALTEPADLHTFLTATGLTATGYPPADLDERHVAQARRLRDGLRRLAAAATSDDRPRAATTLAEPDALHVINDAMATVPHRDVLLRTATGWELRTEADASPEAAFAHLARAGARLLATGDPPLRACRAPGCVLYFTAEHPRREWCSLACGNRARAARHYRRHRDLGGIGAEG
jgi:predicted RNA-binding Zn ribbon-like protein